ncbi:MAG: hypothetical protein QXS54_00960 [Candidatus Methanomethylicaceae archaeon]
MIRTPVIAIVLAFGSVPLQIGAGQRLGAQTRPPIPYEAPGECPFECCTYPKKLIVIRPTILYKRHTERSPIAFRARKGERVTALTGVVITSTPGKAVATKTMIVELESAGTNETVTLKLRAGDVIYLLHYLGEGFDAIWFKGKVFKVRLIGLFENGGLTLLSEPEIEWWIKIRNQRGQVGWTKQTGHFEGEECG